ncbi:putative methylaconitate Delta-isomerase PrpF [Gammaproteobacteria bacterium 42_54_T18]|nr:putative methylaconitate Delta-isomerase PrpF [Gammaproteobacteria bacterium 42_54_T18]
MGHVQQVKIPATYMRGGTSKGLFFNLQDLPQSAQVPGAARDSLMLRIIGSPDPYGKQIDGMGGGTSSTSKTVILSKSNRDDHDVDYLFGQVSINKPFVDWSGNCGNLSAAVGAFAIDNGLVDAGRIPLNGVAVVRIWQKNISKTIIAHVPVVNGDVQENGGFDLDGVTFPAAEIPLEFIDPAGESSELFPTGNLIDDLEVSNDAVKGGSIKATLINAGIPTIFINAKDIGYTGDESQDTINSNNNALTMFENIRANGALRMGLIQNIDEAATHQHTPKIAFVSKATNYISSSGKQVNAKEINLLVRALSMGKLHHAMMGTAAIAIGAAAAIPGTLVNIAAGGGAPNSTCFGHPAGTLRVGVEAHINNGKWTVTKAVMSRSARVLMEGWVRTPIDSKRNLATHLS